MGRFIITEQDKKYIRSLYKINEQEEPIMDVYRALMGDLENHYGEDNVKLLGNPAKIYIFDKPRVTWDGTDLFVDDKRIKVDEFKTKTFGFGSDTNEVRYPNPEYITNRISKSQIEFNNNNFKDGTTLTASQQFWDNIKKDEGLPGTDGEPALKAYQNQGDAVTIGWGHTGMATGPKPKLGDEITKEEAQEYLENDAKVYADCVRGIFTQWKDEEKIETYKVTQNMFDSLVSIAFNAGCQGLRNSNFIQKVKAGKYKEAAEILPEDKTMMPGNQLDRGVKNRRIKEAERFLKGL